MDNELPDAKMRMDESASSKDVATVIPVIEENATIEVVEVPRARVVINKTVEEHEELVNVPLREEEISVERKSIETYVQVAPPTRQEGNTTIYSVVKEVLVVEKRLMLVEEIHVTKRDSIEIHDERVKLRQERISITRQPLDDEHEG